MYGFSSFGIIKIKFWSFDFGFGILISLQNKVSDFELKLKNFFFRF